MIGATPRARYLHPEVREHPGLVEVDAELS